LLATFDAETLVRHRFEVVKQEGIIYYPTYEATRIQDIPNLEMELLDEYVAALREKSFEGTVADLVENAKKSLATGFSVKLRRAEAGERRIFLMGNEAVALGKLAGGCKNVLVGKAERKQVLMHGAIST
jgi:uncharacterized protein YigA (DUF484 family)